MKMIEQDIIKRGAVAISKAGSPEYTTHAGATQTLMSELAGEGQLEAMSTTFLAHVALHPRDRRSLVNRVPPMLSNQYFCGNCQLLGMSVKRWCEANAGWGDLLRQALTDPAHFATVAMAMANEIKNTDG
jgi:hypothetical protein